MMPGTTPARNSAPIDCSVRMPQTIIRTLGGISMPRQEEPATVPRAKPRL